MDDTRMKEQASDSSDSIAGLKKLAIDFRDRRNWKQFHDAKNLAMGLSIEAAELQELFLWKSPAETPPYIPPILISWRRTSSRRVKTALT